MNDIFSYKGTPEYMILMKNKNIIYRYTATFFIVKKLKKTLKTYDRFPWLQ